MALVQENVLNTDATTTMPKAKEFEEGKRQRRMPSSVIEFQKRASSDDLSMESKEVMCMIIKVHARAEIARERVGVSGVCARGGYVRPRGVCSARHARGVRGARARLRSWGDVVCEGCVRVEMVCDVVLVLRASTSLRVCAQAADISNPARRLSVYNKWIDGVMMEFVVQGDYEREKEMPFSMNCDRNSVVLAKAQIGFIGFLVLPLFKALGAYSAAVQPMVQQLEANKAHFESLAAAS
eukprot:4663162-Prymnesium_polylepis.1